jgi:hypothetical protein
LLIVRRLHCDALVMLGGFLMFCSISLILTRFYSVPWPKSPGIWWPRACQEEIAVFTK